MEYASIIIYISVLSNSHSVIQFDLVVVMAIFLDSCISFQNTKCHFIVNVNVIVCDIQSTGDRFHFTRIPLMDVYAEILINGFSNAPAE